MSFTLPVVGDTINTWGTVLNTYLTTTTPQGGGTVYVSGLVADSGVTDNQPAIVAAASLLPGFSGESQGGTLVLPAGTYGMNTYNVPNGVTIVGQGAAGQTGFGGTTLVGLNSAAGTQTEILNFLNKNGCIRDCTVDATGGSSQCQSAIIAAGDQFRAINCSFLNGSVATVILSGNRPYMSNCYTSQSPTTFVQRTIVSTGGLSGTTLTDSGNSFVAADVGRVVSGPGLMAGTRISALIGAGSVTVDQSALATQTSQSYTIYQSLNTVFGGVDGIISDCRPQQGTKVVASNTQFSNCHFTFSSQTAENSAGLCNVLFEQGCTMTNPELDSSPTAQTTVAAGSNTVAVSTFTGAGTLNVGSATGTLPTAGQVLVKTSGTSAVISYTATTATTLTGCNTISGTGTLSTGNLVQMTTIPGTAVHKQGAGQVCISNAELFQNSNATNNYAYIENDTTSSFTVSGGVDTGASASKGWAAILYVGSASNPSGNIQNIYFTTSSLQATGGVPNGLAATGGTFTGTLNFNYGGTLYGFGQTPVTITNAVSGTAYQNNTGYPLYLFENYSSAATAGTVVCAIGSSSSVTSTVSSLATAAGTGNTYQCNITVPPGWWFKFTATTATLVSLFAMG